MNETSKTAESCPHSLSCSACSLWEIPKDQHLNRKRKVFFDLWNKCQENESLPVQHWNAVFEHQCTEGLWLRQRAEMQIRKSKMGFFERAESNTRYFKHPDQSLVEPRHCKVLDPKLKEWVNEIAESVPSIGKGSLRARVSPSGLRGLWLDLPNLAVKTLLENPSWLRKWISRADSIELGQRRKPLLKVSSGELRLSKKLRLLPWTRTWHGETPVDLYSTVGDFSQPSDGANRVIARLITSLLKGSQQVFEFGAGFGNLSIPALSSGAQVIAIERNPRCEEAVQKTLAALTPEWSKPLSGRLSWRTAWAKEDSQIEHCDTLLLNPSREGASQFLSQKFSSSVSKVVMMSCYPESFIHDVGLLRKQGFGLGELHLIDQFPYTDHLEVIGTLHR